MPEPLVPIIATETFEGVTTEEVLAWILGGLPVAEEEEQA